MDYDYEFTIDCEPKAQGRPRSRIIQPKDKSRPPFVLIYDDPKSAKAKLLFAVEARQYAPEKLIDQAIRVDTTFYMPRPKSHYGTGRNSDKLKDSAPTFHIKKPDRDNFDKLVLDALTGVIWTDDSIVCKGFIEKVYARKPRVEVKIKLLEETSETLF